MRACARANGAMRSCPEAASGITKAPPTSTDPFASRRSVTPISRGHANALGFQHPGAFCFWRSRKGNPHDQNAIASRSRSIRAFAGPRQGNPRRRKDAPCLDASARAASGCNRTRIGGFDVMSEAPMRNIDKRSTTVRARMPVRCARYCRGVCRGSGEGVPRADDSSGAEQRRKPLATGSNPVRPPLDSSVG